MDQCEDKEDGVPTSSLCGEHENQTKAQRKQPEPEPEPSCVSFRSDKSMGLPYDFKQSDSSEAKVDHQSSEVLSSQSAQQHQTPLDSIFMLLEDNIVTFVKDELKKIQKVVSVDDPECSESWGGNEEVMMKSRG
ncbi:hypothetical protein AMECASPLE_031635 [Ameca splendens]|uniref:Uncharacterized protein n=1 Tax=Ameca splendens TaxID=208324 RepID=A0ABV0Z5X6_9TELE